jgi:hypothetical protein
MERKQNNTREKQNVKETEQYKRDSRMSRNTTIQERERQQNAKETEQYNRDNTRYFLFRDRKVGVQDSCSSSDHDIENTCTPALKYCCGLLYYAATFRDM